MRNLTLAILMAMIGSLRGAQSEPPPQPNFNAARPLYVYTLAQDGTPESYDEAMAVACLQGIINRAEPQVYLLSRHNTRPRYWLDLLTRDGRWMQRREQKPLKDLDALKELAGQRLKGAVIWDPAVPASANVATSVAGVEDGVVLSPEFAERYLPRWQLKVLDPHTFFALFKEFQVHQAKVTSP